MGSLHLAAIFVLSQAIACGRGRSPNPAVAASNGIGSATSEAHPQDTTFLEYLAHHAPQLGRDTLFLYSAEHDSTWPFAGLPMDVVFSDSVGQAYPRFRSGYPPILLVGALRLDSQVTGYLVRVPGMYESFTKLGLLVYDSTRQVFGPGVELAEAWGDAGYSYSQCAWLVMSGTGKGLQLYRRVRHSEIDLNTRALLRESDSLTVRSWTGRTFTTPRLIRDRSLHDLYDDPKWLDRHRAPA